MVDFDYVQDILNEAKEIANQYKDGLLEEEAAILAIATMAVEKAKWVIEKSNRLEEAVRTFQDAMLEVG